MRETTWDECLENNSTKTITPDEQRSASLIETAFARLDVIGDITEKNCNFVFEDYYTSIIELIEARAFKEGYNIINHICLGFYLRDQLERDDLFNIFDDVRYKRNSLTYYGKMMDFNLARHAIDRCKHLIKELK